MADKLRIGLVGATPGRGWGPRAHIPAYRALSDQVELTAICTARPETAEAAAKEWGVGEYYSDYHKLVNSPNVDVVCVVTRILLHTEISRAAIEAGKAVYSEWPLGTDTADAEAVAGFAQAHGGRTMVGLQARFAPHFARMRELIDEGFIGRPLTAQCTSLSGASLTPRPSYYAFVLKKTSGWGALSIGTGHAIATLSWLLGGIQAVSGAVSTQIPEAVLPDTGEKVTVESPDTVTVALRTKSGATGILHVSNAAYNGSGFRLEVYGTEGKLAVTCNAISDFGPDGRFLGARLGEADRDIEIPARLMTVPGLQTSQPAYNIARLFQAGAAALREGRDPVPGFADAARLHRLLDGIQQSSDTGRWVDVSDTF